MNAPFAVLKVGFYILLAILGFSLHQGDHKGSDDWGQKPRYSGLGALSAMTHIIYSYQGFEDINCVGFSFSIKFCHINRYRLLGK